ncbi:MAG: Haloalkane dehalogenase 2 [Myxococcota bacterium]|nr:Haloalkane dehalogenase 2 [Myxococcota bacterium]
MAWVEEGSGFPVVMVHGNPTWSFYYRNLIRALSPHFRAIAPDHIGCGFSSKPDDKDYSYRLDQRVADFGAFIQGLGLQRLSLVVHDWGGMIGMAWAAEHPEMIERIVILNTAAFPKPAAKRLPFTLKLARDSRLGAFLVRGFNAFSAGAAFLAVEKPMPAAVRAGYTAPYQSWDDRIATLRFVQDIPLSPQDPSYAVVARTAERLHVFGETPMLIAWGMRDFVFDHHFLDEWKRRCPHARVQEYPDCGHYVLEDAAGRIEPLIAGFLRGI